ncbi:uncharacterized protein J8A68_004729 [[Candida] subhashii]|uniref:Translin n=1 Tax=[Candida] subhashii TaxID=561895 RepID=A0A8J5QII1_9ASCO|nr:uncharacterized protein J8A68_004729 [[Candida] subhashii]KAG7661781.1 hypothetical protein J8A68_004729 [[Candida] subhashii]
MTNIIEEIFIPAREYLHTKQDDREQIIRIGRDITNCSKKLIFSLHRLDLTNGVSINDSIKNEMFKHLETISNRLYQLNIMYGTNKNLRSTISNSIEELIEFLTFGYFLKHQQLLQFDKLINIIKLLIKSEDYNGREKEQYFEVILFIVLLNNKDIPVELLNQVDALQIDFIDISDLLMGLFDCTGEIMKLCISNSSNNSGTLELTNTLNSYKYLKHLHQSLIILKQQFPILSIYHGVFEINGNYRSSLVINKKMDVFTNSLNKIETTLIDNLISDQEILQ